MNPYRSQHKPIFVTFYSFKGGVGRTMALVNAACILAGRGRRVLMIDFDLEAPGLTLLALKELVPEPEVRPAGLVELIHDFLNDPPNSPLADTENKTRFREHYVCPLRIPEDLKKLDGGYLDLMPSGRLDETYEKRLYDIKFDELYEVGVGLPLFKHFKNVIKESGLYDYVLIDSRTGFSDEGGICTRDLADHIVVLMGLNRQNVDGTVRFLQRLKSSGWQEGRVIFVASPVPIGDEQLRNERMAEARRAIEEVGFPADLSLRIPYHPRLSLDEEPFVFHWSETDIFPAYERIQRVLRELAQDIPQTWGREIADALNRRRFEDVLFWLREIHAEDPNMAISLLSVITGGLMDDIPGLQEHADPFFELWLDIVGDDPEVHRRYGVVLTHRGENGRAYEELTHSLTLACERRDERSTANARLWLGNLLLFRGQYNEALNECELAVKMFEELDDQLSATIVYRLIGRIHRAQGNFETALAAFERALKMAEELDDQQETAAVLGGIGKAQLLTGEVIVGRRMIEQAIKVFEELRLSVYVAQGHVDYSESLLLSGDAQAALTYLTDHWDLIQQHAYADMRAEAHVLRAKIKAALGDSEGAAQDAQVALDFYRAQNVSTALAQEAEELARAVEAKPS